MNRFLYYEAMKALARGVRERYGFVTARVRRSDLRRIFRDEGVRVDLWQFPPSIRGAYFNDQHGASVAINRTLPEDPAVFTMAHELKHHLRDRNRAVSYCAGSNQSDAVEIGAEIFAAELIFPEQDFLKAMSDLGVTMGMCEPHHIARIKHETQTTLSHQGLVKRAIRLGFANRGRLDGIRWRDVHDELYGIPSWRKRFGRGRA